MDSHKVSSDNARVLAQWLHELGDILFFQDDEELGDIVMLKPQWVSRYISMVLESEEVIKRLGVLTRAHRDALWKDIEPAMREHFLRLMERFDLSHRTLEDRDVSLIVERLPLDPPNYEEKWEAMLGSNNCQEIAMKYRLNTIQAGIPTWFIARSHRFTTQTHWRTGALFADTPQGTHLALVQAFPHDRYVSLVVRGPHPQNFFALLRDGLELTLKRFPGLKVHRLVPCPGHGGQPCGHEFRYEQLLNRLERPTAKYHIECPESYQEVDARDLLFGLAPRTFGAVHREIIRSVRGGGDSHVELIPLLQREFSKSHQREQARIESHCPSVFALRQIKTRRGRQSILQLYCEAPGCWHPVQSDDQYIVDQAVKWVRKQEPHLKQMAPLLRYVSLAAGPWTSLGPEEYERSVRYDIRFMLQLAKTLEETTAAGEMGVSEDGNGVIDRDRARVVALRALRQLLDEKDPERRWGGLRKVLTPEGHYLWLCEYHAKEYAH
jgi:hypothetical protein